MSGVKDADNRLRLNLNTFSDNGSVNGVSDPILSLVVLTFEIFNRLPLPDMLLPNLVDKLLRPAFILKLFATIRASVVLDAPSFSVLLYTRIFTVRALFLDIVCSF
jgi:hypothetical protein